MYIFFLVFSILLIENLCIYIHCILIIFNPLLLPLTLPGSPTLPSVLPTLSFFFLKGLPESTFAAHVWMHIVGSHTRVWLAHQKPHLKWNWLFFSLSQQPSTAKSLSATWRAHKTLTLHTRMDVDPLDADLLTSPEGNHCCCRFMRGPLFFFQKALFGISPPWPLAFTIFLFPLLGWSQSLGDKHCDINVIFIVEHSMTFVLHVLTFCGFLF